MSKRIALDFLAAAVGLVVALCPSAALTALMRPTGVATAATVFAGERRTTEIRRPFARTAPSLFLAGLAEQNLPPADVPGPANNTSQAASPARTPGGERPGWMEDWRQVTPGADAPQASLPEDTTPQSLPVTGGAAPAHAAAAPPVTHRVPRMGKVAPSYAPPRTGSPASLNRAAGDSAQTASPAAPHGVASDAATVGARAASDDAARAPADSTGRTSAAPGATMVPPASPDASASPGSSADTSASPPPALDVSTVSAGPDLSDSSLAPEIAKATTPALAASLRFTEEARRQLAEKKTDEAIRTLARAVSIDPGNPFEYFLLGRSYVAKRNCQQAMTFFKRAEIGFVSRPDWLAETLSREGACYEEAGQLSAAAKAYSQALSAAPNNVMARVGYGRVAPNVPASGNVDPTAPNVDSAPPPPDGSADKPAPAEPPPPPAEASPQPAH